MYIVSTPIGNLEDITLRALRVLKSVDIIAAENVAHTRGLCAHYGIKTKLASYNEHNQRDKAPKLIRVAKSGSDLALVTDAGTPGISDPGVYLINRVVEENIRVVPIPGPSAVIAALSVSGLPTGQFVFVGFLPRKRGKRRRALDNLVNEARTMVFFEAPHRVKAMLTDLREIFGNRQMVMLREMTKLFEEVKRGQISTILEHLTPDRLKGEFALVLAGVEDGAGEQALGSEFGMRIEALLAEKTMSIRDMAELLASEGKVPYRKVYKECIARKNALERFEVDGVGREAQDQEQFGIACAGRCKDNESGQSV